MENKNCDLDHKIERLLKNFYCFYLFVNFLNKPATLMKINFSLFYTFILKIGIIRRRICDVRKGKAMPINFTQLFKDSWHFLQNERKFAFIFLSLFVLASAGFGLLQQAIFPVLENVDSLTEEQQMDVLLQQSSDLTFLWFTLAKGLATVFIVYWGTLTVHHISQRQSPRLAHMAGLTFSRLIGIILLTVLCFLPFFIGAIGTIAGVLSQSSLSFVSLFLMVSGIFILIRLCLAPVRYLVANETLKSAVQNSLNSAKGRASVLFFYCTISYLFFPLIGFQLALLAQNFLLTVIALIIMSLINVFSIVFTYRFYSVFNQQA